MLDTLLVFLKITLILLVSLFILNIINTYRIRSKIKKKIKETKEELEANKCKGPHSWIYMDLLGKKTNVCKECCYVPKHDNYVRRIFVDAELKKIEFEKEFEQFKQKEISNLADKYNVTSEQMNDIYDSLVAIKKNFTTKKLDEFLSEMKG